jgi:hypothetical protein
LDLDQRISGSAVNGAPTEEPRPDASNARRQRPATKGNWRVPCSCLCVKHPWLPTGVCLALPRSSILCGCIIFPGKQINAVWGRCPTACAIYANKAWGVLGARRQNLSRLRVEKLGCATRSWPCLVTALSGVLVGLVALGLFVHPLRTEFVPCPSLHANGGRADRGFVPAPLCRGPYLPKLLSAALEVFK